MATKSRASNARILRLKSSMMRLREMATSRLAGYLSRRPHRSFRRTRRRDYVRSLSLPGYVAFSLSVMRIIRNNKWLFTKLVAFYALLGVLFIGLASQSSYAELSDLLNEEDWSSLSGGWALVSQGAVLLLLGLSGGVNAELTDIQQVYAVVIFLLTWLTTVWLLRAVLAGQKPKLRDGLYNSGAPIVTTGVVTLILIIQMIPAIAAITLYSAAASSELLDTALISMLAGIGVVLLCILSLYWAVATFIALVIATLPGMYPWQAIRAAGDIVTGRRLRLLLRVIWMFIGNIAALIVVVLPVVLFDKWVKSLLPFIDSVPIVPVAVSILSSAIVIWSATYVYILYRKVVEDDSDPA